MSAWVKQIASQVKIHGAKKASWYCVWVEPDGTRRKKSCGAGQTGKRDAERMAEKRKAELLLGTYKREEKKSWAEFVQGYENRVLSQMRPNSRTEICRSLQHVTRIVKPKLVTSITSERIASFISQRREEKGRKPDSNVTAATVNKDLRQLKAALNVAREWGYIDTVPKIRFLKEPKRLPTYVTAEDFAAIYEACDVAAKPTDIPYSASDWWRGLMMTAQMTGWRISEILALKWSDVNLDEGTAITRHRDNKGGRDEVVNLHPIVVDHIRPLRCFHPDVFPWDHDRRTLDTEFAKIQDEGGIHIACKYAGDEDHGKCTDACHRYGFHDERRAFATFNAENMTREALQALMRHQSSMTTDRYINMVRQIKPAVANLHVPQVTRPNRSAEGA